MVYLRRLPVFFLVVLSLAYFAAAMEHLASFKLEEAVSGLLLLGIAYWLGTIARYTSHSVTTA